MDNNTYLIRMGMVVGLCQTDLPGGQKVAYGYKDDCGCLHKEGEATISRDKKFQKTFWQTPKRYEVWNEEEQTSAFLVRFNRAIGRCFTTFPGGQKVAYGRKIDSGFHKEGEATISRDKKHLNDNFYNKLYDVFHV